MPARYSGFRHVAFCLALAATACLAGFSGQRSAEAQCVGCGTDQCACPAPEPQLETSPGTSLYFNDPCGGGYECSWTRFYCHDGSPAKWYVKTEFMPMFRDGGKSFPMQSRGPASIPERTLIPGAETPDTEVPPIVIPPTEMPEVIIPGEGGAPDIVIPAYTIPGQTIPGYTIPGVTLPDEYVDVGAPIPDVILGTGDFDPELDPGVRLTIGYALGDWYRIEGSWRGGYSWSDSATVRDSNSQLYSPFYNFGDPDNYFGDGVDPPFDPTTTVFDENNMASIGFTSTMNDAELNILRRVRMRRGGALQGRHRGIGEAAFLVGLRYMDISETFNYLTDSDANGITDIAVETNNDMFGVQIGGLAQILVDDRAWVDVDIKGVAFFNQAGVESTYNTFDPFADEADRATFMGDLSVTFNYQFARAWTFRVGYNALWLSGVALATENFNTDIDTLELGPANVNHSGNVAYHGPQIGFVWTR